MNRLLKCLEWCFGCFGFALMIVAALAAPANSFAVTIGGGGGGSTYAICSTSCADAKPRAFEGCMTGCCETQCAKAANRAECVTNCAASAMKAAPSCADDCTGCTRNTKCDKYKGVDYALCVLLTSECTGPCRDLSLTRACDGCGCHDAMPRQARLSCGCY
jgi:hypothetical protein